MSRILWHIPLRSPISYTKAAQIQDTIVRYNLSQKAVKSPTQDVVLTMEMEPVYTTGRRERGVMTPQEKAQLAKHASVVQALRGGQTTFHGPGQLVAYPIINLRTTPRCYVHMLEQSLIDTLRAFNVQSFRTEHTGVWVDQDTKIAAIGVHMRRGITSHGVALNSTVDLSYFDNITACGLPGAKTSSILDFSGQRIEMENLTATYLDTLAGHLDSEVRKVELDEFQKVMT